MSCTFLSNRARKLNQLHKDGVIGSTMDINDLDALPEINRNILRDAEKLIGAVPSRVNPLQVNGVGSNGKPTVAVDNELFYRMDAAEGIVYDENEKFVKDFTYPVEQGEVNQDALSERLIELLEGIGIGTAYKDTGDLAGISDTLGKMVYLSYDKSDIGTLSEEAAHMFVDFIEVNEPRLFNTMMADVTKLPIYQEVKDAYMPVYQDINKVRKEAIGKALRDYLVLGRTDATADMPTSWLDKILDAFKRVLAKVGITSTYDYNNMFQITAQKILRGDFEGEFTAEQTGNFYSMDGTPMSKLDAMNDRINFNPETHKYSIEGKEIQWSVTEKIKALDKSIPREVSERSKQIMQLGTDGHDDLQNIWKKKLGLPPGYDFVPKSNRNVVLSLGTFVDAMIAQFPNAKFRTEYKIYDGKKTAGMIDLLVEDEDGRLHFFDYKFSGNERTYLAKDHDKQLKDYKRILRTYGFEKFGQIRVIPIKSHYEETGKNVKLKSIEIGQNKLYKEAEYLNPLPSLIERSGDSKIDNLVDFLQEELTRTTNSRPTDEAGKQERIDRISALYKAIAELQISQDVVPLTTIAQNDLRRMQSIMNSSDPSAGELQELYKLSQHYTDFVKKGYSKDKDGNQVAELVEASSWAQDNFEAAEQKLLTFWEAQGININTPIKPSTWWNRLTRLSDYDMPAFQALQRLLSKGFNQNEILKRKNRSEIEDILKQVKSESSATGTAIFDPILDRSKGKLIKVRDDSWYEMHRQVIGDRKLKSTLNQYFDKAAWDEHFNPILAAYAKRNETKENRDQLVAGFKASQEKIHGIGNANSKFFTVPDKFLNPEWVKIVRDAPDSGLAKLYNKYIEINEYAYNNVDTDIPRQFLPYVRKDALDTLMDSGLQFGKIATNAVKGLTNYEWETFDIDSNGQRVYSVPLKYGTPTRNRDLSTQSYDLGEMLYLWQESVYDNAYLQQTRSTAELYGLALEKSKQIVIKNRKPVYKNGELRTVPTDSETNNQYQEYLNMYYFGVRDEGSDSTIFGLSTHKVAKTAMKSFSSVKLALQPFSALANITGGFSNSIAIGSKGSYFTNKQLAKGMSSLMDVKARGLISLMDIDAGAFDREKANGLAVDKINQLLTWDSLFVLQRKGDWLLQNSTLLAMAQNYTVKDGKIVRKTAEDQSILEQLDYDTEGKLKISGLDLQNNENYTELLKWREQIRSVNSEIMGSTSEQDKFLAGNTLMGQLILQFRRWMLPMGVSRFGTLRYNENLKEFQYGRYRSTAAALFDKRIFKSLGEFIAQQNSPSFQEILKDQYEAKLALNPKLTYEEFVTLYKQNARTVVAEAAVLALVSALLQGLRGDDGEETGPVAKFFIRALTRTSNELSFWYNTDSFLNIVQVPVPIISLVEDLAGLMGAAKDTIWGSITDDAQMIDNADLGDKVLQTFPGTNAYYQFMNELDKDDDA